MCRYSMRIYISTYAVYYILCIHSICIVVRLALAFWLSHVLTQF